MTTSIVNIVEDVLYYMGQSKPRIVRTFGCKPIYAAEVERQDLIQQCDHKLMLGGMGVGVCGTCTYAPVPWAWNKLVKTLGQNWHVNCLQFTSQVGEEP